MTSDISTGLRTPLAEAEKIKIKYGCAMTAMIPKDETIRVPSLGGREDREVSRQILGRIVEPRMEEILNLAYNEVVRFGFEDLLAAGVVLTGGTSLLEGISELAEKIFDMPARKGIPIGVGGLNDIANSPAHAIGVGLIIYGNDQDGDSLQRKTKGVFGNMARSVKKMFSEIF